jgi:hypothetical protein
MTNVHSEREPRHPNVARRAILLGKRIYLDPPKFASHSSTFTTRHNSLLGGRTLPSGLRSHKQGLSNGLSAIILRARCV